MALISRLVLPVRIGVRSIHLSRFLRTENARVLPSLSLRDKTCVVTGAARGLGYQFCKAFALSGSSRIGLLDLKQRDAEEAAANLATELAELHGIAADTVDIRGFACDVTNEEAVKNTFGAVKDIWGKVDSVVASAGIVENYPAFDYPTDRIKLLYDVNVHGVFFTAREAAKSMIKTGGGSIILIASMSSHIINTPQFQTPYNASKAAVKHMASSLAVEWAEAGIRVNSLSPGYMLTKLTKTVLSGNTQLREHWEEMTPMKRMGVPEDLDGAIVFLASDSSRFVTGVDIRVDGGYCVV